MKIDCQNEFFRDSLESYLRTIVPELMSWFDRVYSIETIERELDEQRHSPEWCYRIHYPSPRFVLAFLKSAKGDISAAKQLLRSLYAYAGSGSFAPSEELQTALLDKLFSPSGP